MCGRYVFETKTDLAQRYRTQYVASQEMSENYNVAPTQYAPVVTYEGIEQMKWGLIPSWSKAPKMAFSTFNARAESVAEKPMFRGPFKHRRCLVPAAGFYEWLKSDDSKLPYYFSLPQRPVFSFAGVYDEWRDAEDHPLRSYTIITTTANAVMAPIHDRMPVILEPEEEADWLNPTTDTDKLQLLLDPLDPSLMQSHRVSTQVNSSRSRGEELRQPLNSQ